jgi:methylmalonyl-CoA mutase
MWKFNNYVSLQRRTIFKAFSTYPPEWEKRALKELGSSTNKISSLEWITPEGITLKPVYTKDDFESSKDELPGFYPFKRGPYATMYTSKP